VLDLRRPQQGLTAEAQVVRLPNITSFSMRRLLYGFIAVATCGVPPLVAQDPRWVVTTHLQGGLYFPTHVFNSRGNTQARMRQAPVIAASLQLGHAGSPIGLYVASTQALQGGIWAWRTSDCTINCQPQTLDHGRFWTLTAGLLLGVNWGRNQIVANIGGGWRTYATYGEDIVAIAPRPGEFWPAWYLGSSSDPALHVGLLLGRHLGRYVLFARIEDFIAGSQLPDAGSSRKFNDLTITLGSHLPWPSR